MPAVISRWHWVWLKKPASARWTNELTVQGARELSPMTMLPRLVRSTAVYLTSVFTLAGGRDTLRPEWVGHNDRRCPAPHGGPLLATSPIGGRPVHRRGWCG